MFPSVRARLLVDLSNSLAEKLDPTTIDKSNTSGDGCVREPARGSLDAGPRAQRRARRSARTDHQRLRVPAPALAGRGGGNAPGRSGEQAAAVAFRDHAPARPAGGPGAGREGGVQAGRAGELRGPHRGRTGEAEEARPGHVEDIESRFGAVLSNEEIATLVGLLGRLCETTEDEQC